MGLNEIVVADDGIGIDAEAMRELIGTEYCSNDEGTGRKGETLRSLALLCVEMKVETACWCCDNSVPRQTTSSSGSSKLIVSEKLLRDGSLVFFNRSPGIIPNDNNKATKTGTVVTLRGLFHRHAVRRKHHTQSKQDKASNGREFAHIRACLRLLALSYPTVSFQLRDGTTEKVDLSCSSSLQTLESSRTLSFESRALLLRLRELYPDDFPQEDSTELSLEEDHFRAFGVLCISKDDDDGVAVRNRELEIICINGRLATNRDKLADAISNQMRLLCKGSKSNCRVRFFIHVTSSVSELVGLEVFVKKMVAKAVMESEQTTMDRVRDGNQNSIWTKQKCDMNNGHSRVVIGQQIVSSRSKATHVTKRSRSPTSPFSDAFFDTDHLRMSTEMKPSAVEDLSLRSLEDAFLDEDKPELNYEYDGEQDTAASSWTKQRVEGLENIIAGLAPGTNSKITLSKQMLSSAEVIAQVELKFIIIKTCGIICAVDQHAADERVALEKLERALSNPDMHDDTIIHMTKRSIAKRDLLKQTKVIPSKRISLSQKDMATVKHHWSLIKKWKFEFDFEDNGTLLTLTGLPAVCDRVASVRDFLDFVKELGHLSGGEVCPKFVKNIVARYACRYAIMFGDYVSHEMQIELIRNLAKCNFCFICAHGRPSIIPLFDMNSSSTFV
ncbi:hypothetical protein ACHAW5_010140 [Stephanodiscus triporus]|uniref:MutL C-terminal dimerisation domain-containing protein n=1 Tax=Stephanodiscus triporus TaxID=2934178 RepID=A0ABD3NZG0_9STRA